MKKIILVTGANKGIGYEIVRQLAALGETVILTARDPEKGKLAQDQLAKSGLHSYFLALDVTDREQIRAAAERVKYQFDRLDILINNAGILLKNDNSILDFDRNVLDDTLQTNAVAVLNMVSAFSPLMPAGGRIIHLSSGGGSMTDPVGGWAPIYCISKSLLNAITRQQAHFLKNRNIPVNAVCPGWVRTDMGGAGASRHVSEGADTAVWLATTDHIPSGKFWRDRKVIPW